uniref:response regulator n=1 Tax=Thaumasiovibrio occultus TaxID=1891184 RepID=UPI000B34B76A|nr:response regulator [Thaumasiovibrio occultus]
MNKLLIICIDDEREILDSVVNDLKDFESHFDVEACQSAAEAEEVIQEANRVGQPLALVLCDHIMPETTGVDFLIQLTGQTETKATRKVLLTGQAGLEETVEAVNHASLDYFIAKPWQKDELNQVVKSQLTEYVIATEQDLIPWMAVLNTDDILKAISEKRMSFGE